MEFSSKTLDRGEKALRIFFTKLAKAFDTVDHKLLRKAFSSFGVTGNCLIWFKSYPNKRKQITNVNGVLGQENEVLYGVFQESVLFSIHIRSLC